MLSSDRGLVLKKSVLLLIVQIFGVRAFWTQNNLHGLTAMNKKRCQQRQPRALNDLLENLDFLSETVQVEIVADVLLVDFDEKLVAFEVAKPTNPAISRLAVVVVIQLI